MLRLEPSELHALALLRAETLNIGVVASVANALESGTFPQFSSASIGTFVPNQSSFFEAVIHGLSANTQLSAIAQLTQSLMTQMLLALGLSSAFLASAEQGRGR